VRKNTFPWIFCAAANVVQAKTKISNVNILFIDLILFFFF